MPQRIVAGGSAMKVGAGNPAPRYARRRGNGDLGGAAVDFGEVTNNHHLHRRIRVLGLPPPASAFTIASPPWKRRLPSRHDRSSISSSAAYSGIISAADKLD